METLQLIRQTTDAIRARNKATTSRCLAEVQALQELQVVLVETLALEQVQAFGVTEVG